MGPKVHMEIQGSQNSQNSLEKRGTKLKESHFLSSKLATVAAVIKTVGIGVRIDTDQWNRFESPEMSAHI